MTATEELRLLLDERGVEWASAHEWEGKTFWPDANGINATSTDWGHGLLVHAVLTPEQAIAATLGTRTLTAEQVMAIAGRHQPDYCSDTHVCFDWQAIADELNATLGDVPRLPHFWTHDGVLHIELPKLPNSISVLLPDERDREVHSARVWRYTLDNGTCREVYLLMATDIGDGREEVLGVYATEEAAMAAINENQFGYALHHVRKWEVDA